MAEAPSQDRLTAGSAHGRMRLLEAVPNLVEFLSIDERRAVERLSVPVVRVTSDALDVTELLERTRAFAATVTDGLVLNYLALGAESGLRILGPGDVVMPLGPAAGGTLASARYRAPVSTGLALLGGDALLAAGRPPRVLAALLDAVADQTHRLATQLAICQLPRVADRVQAMLWLLAETFGRVTPSGTRLPLSLTHEAIGALVGARRPTVTLALGELAKRDAVVRQDAGWLLLEPPPMLSAAERPRILDEPALLDHEPSGWAVEPEPERRARETLAMLVETVNRLHEQNRLTGKLVDERLRRSRLSRERSSEVLRRVRAERRISRRSPPSA